MSKNIFITLKGPANTDPPTSEGVLIIMFGPAGK